MQALIDFDGWRKWKDFTKTQSNATGTDASARKASGTGHKSSPTGPGGGSMTNSSGGTGGGKLALSSAPGRRDKRQSSSTLTTISGSGSEGIEGDREPRGSAIIAGA